MRTEAEKGVRAAFQIARHILRYLSYQITVRR